MEKDRPSTNKECFCDSQKPKIEEGHDVGFSEDEISVIVYLCSSLDHDCREIRQALENPPEGIFILPEASYYRDYWRETDAFPELFKNR
jgi:hypothetical protein